MFRVRVVFLLGVAPNEMTSDEQQYQINYEHDVYGTNNESLIQLTSIDLLFLSPGDIIQENFVDSYNNLTLKTILMLKWTNRNCFNKGKALAPNYTLGRRASDNFSLIYKK